MADREGGDRQQHLNCALWMKYRVSPLRITRNSSGQKLTSQSVLTDCGDSRRALSFLGFVMVPPGLGAWMWFSC